MKIAQIRIRDFRAFPNGESHTFDLNGKNLLVFGENGSGKSSLFRATKEFFSLEDEAPELESFRNVYSREEDTTTTDSSIELTFSDGTSHSWLHGRPRPFIDPAVPMPSKNWLVESARRSGFIEYRSLLKTNFQIGELRAQLFDLAVNTLLSNVPIMLAGEAPTSLGELWVRVLNRRPNWRNANQIATIKYLTHIFNHAFAAVLPDVRALIAEYLHYFENADLDVQFTNPGIVYEYLGRTLTKSAIERRYLDVETQLHGLVLNEWHEFLNEARLSAFALSLYLASIRLCNPVIQPAARTPLQLLVLDDVLVGIDHKNRLPVLRILEEKFSEFQIIILTHDKVWFDMAQLAIRTPTDWRYCEMSSKAINIAGKTTTLPVSYFHAEADLAAEFIARAKAATDNRVAALYARTALEFKLKSYCSKHSVQVAYDLDGRKLTTEDFIDAVTRRFRATGEMPLYEFGLNRVKLFRSGVLNPMAHFHPITLDTNEVSAAINAVENLCFAKVKGSDLATKTGEAITANKRIEAVTGVRTLFEVQVRKLLERLGGQVRFRHDWNTIGLHEVWSSVQVVMRTRNSALATSLITDIDAHRAILLEEWTYNMMSSHPIASIENAWNAIRDPAHRTKTRLETFRE